MANYWYGGCAMRVEPAEAVTGVLISTADGHRFRVYQSDHTFTDYRLAHDDLRVTIACDELAAFYCPLAEGEGNGEPVLDHSPAVLGLKKLTANNEYDEE